MLGPSGSGKTTCLRLIAGFEQPTAGHIEIFGERADGVPPYRRNVNTVFQDYALFPHLNVIDNVAYGLMVKGVGKAERLKAAEQALELVRLPGYGARRPGQLSGGQRQRVALARALVNRPKVLLLDEPLGALDLKLRENMQEELKLLQKSLGITFIFVTHDQGEALSMADRVAVFNDGRIMQVGAPQEIYQRPASRFVADFVGSSNVLPPDFVQRYSGQRRWASLRPEAIRVGSQASGDGVPARVVSLNYLGAATRIALDAEGLRLHATMPAGAAVPTEGDAVTLTFNREQLHLMEEA
jgi:putative spermidine/putrescine transport system ATP-binding protein